MEWIFNNGNNKNRIYNSNCSPKFELSANDPLCLNIAKNPQETMERLVSPS